MVLAHGTMKTAVMFRGFQCSESHGECVGPCEVQLVPNKKSYFLRSCNVKPSLIDMFKTYVKNKVSLLEVFRHHCCKKKLKLLT